MCDIIIRALAKFYSTSAAEVEADIDANDALKRFCELMAEAGY